ncbi:LysM protein, partial [human gut metagenome]
KVEYTVLYLAREEGLIINSVNYTQKFTSNIDLNQDEHKVICGLSIPTLITDFPVNSISLFALILFIVSVFFKTSTSSFPSISLTNSNSFVL